MAKANKQNLVTANAEENSLAILKSLRRIIRAVDLNSKKLHSQTNLTAAQLLALITIANNEKITLAKVAEQVHLSASTLVGIIDRLESKELVLRERSTEDRRQVYIYVTDKGKKLASKSPEPLQETLLKELELLSGPQQKAIIRSLEQLIGMIEAGSIDASPILSTGCKTL